MFNGGIFNIGFTIFFLAILLSYAVLCLSLYLLWGRWPFHRREHYDRIDYLLNKLINDKMPLRSEIVHELTQIIADYRARRNEFLTLFGQIIISVFIATMLGLLLLAGVVEADAALPIISGLSGFAIAKTVGSAKTRETPRLRD